jgi:hypothetical protein
MSADPAGLDPRSLQALRERIGPAAIGRALTSLLANLARPQARPDRAGRAATLP